jgi:hypothetical protein
MIFMCAPNNVLFYGTTALFNETLFPKCPTTKVPPVTEIRNKKKKSTGEQPPVVIEFGDDLLDDNYDLLPYSPQPPNEPTGPLQGPNKPPSLPMGPMDSTPPPSTPPMPKNP